MARVRYFNGAETRQALKFGEFSITSITEFTETRIELTGRDGQKFIIAGTGFAINILAGSVAGNITRVDWLDPNGVLLTIVDQLNYSAQEAFDAVIGEPEPGHPTGPEALFVDGLAGNDIIFGSPTTGANFWSNEQLYNLIYVGLGNDTVTGGPAPERIQVGDGGAFRFDGGGGIDCVDYLYGSFHGTRGIAADLITGNIINPFNLVDHVVRVENVYGTIYDDVIRGSEGGNVLDGGAGGKDIYLGRGGNDTIVSSFDTIVTGKDDTLDGGDGADYLNPGIGADVIIGGAGFDVVAYLRNLDEPDPALIIVDLVNAANNTGNAANDTLSGIEGFDVDWGTFNGPATTVRFTGNAAINSFTSRGWSTDLLLGNGGNDTLDAGNGAGDTLRGGDGNDVLAGGDGGDVIDGGAGFDAARFFYTTEIDLMNLAASKGDAAGDTFISIEAYQDVGRFWGNNFANIASGDGSSQLFGRGGNDTLTGGVLRDVLSGGAGNDRLDGNDGVDTINGGDGNDRLTGGTGIYDDILVGAAGNDTITGGGRVDSMSGGGGADVFVFASLADTGIPGDFTAIARDHITDFQLGPDKLTFAAAGFAGLKPAFGFVEGAAPVAAANTGTFLFDTDDGRLLYDSDGRGPRGAVLLMVLDGVTHLTRDAFEIV